MASQTAGIQQLLAAEKRAADKINEARKRKARRLKQAKEEAQQEVDKYKQERDKAFSDYQTRHLGNKDDVAAKIKAQTQLDLQTMHKDVAKKQPQVIDRLLSLVCDVRPEIHHNLRQNLVEHDD